MQKLQILDVQPSALPKTNCKIWLSIIGEGLDIEESVVTIKTLDAIQVIPKSRTRVLDSTLIQICIVLNGKEESLEIEVRSSEVITKWKLI